MREIETDWTRKTPTDTKETRVKCREHQELCINTDTLPRPQAFSLRSITKLWQKRLLIPCNLLSTRIGPTGLYEACHPPAPIAVSIETSKSNSHIFRTGSHTPKSASRQCQSLQWGLLSSVCCNCSWVIAIVNHQPPSSRCPSGSQSTITWNSSWRFVKAFVFFFFLDMRHVRTVQHAVWWEPNDGRKTRHKGKKQARNRQGSILAEAKMLHQIT